VYPISAWPPARFPHKKAPEYELRPKTLYTLARNPKVLSLQSAPQLASQSASQTKPQQEAACGTARLLQEQKLGLQRLRYQLQEEWTSSLELVQELEQALALVLELALDQELNLD